MDTFELSVFIIIIIVAFHENKNVDTICYNSYHLKYKKKHIKLQSLNWKFFSSIRSLDPFIYLWILFVICYCLFTIEKHPFATRLFKIVSFCVVIVYWDHHHHHFKFNLVSSLNLLKCFGPSIFQIKEGGDGCG